jgi:hypothetical protein
VHTKKEGSSEEEDDTKEVANPESHTIQSSQPCFQYQKQEETPVMFYWCCDVLFLALMHDLLVL